MNLKKRVLAFVLVMVMVLNWVPLSAARGVTKADMSQSSGGNLGLTASSGIKPDSGFATNNGLTKYEKSSLEPFSAMAKDFVYEADELVTFVVVLDKTPLLKSFTSDQIGQQTEAVKSATEALEADIAAVQAEVEKAFGEAEGFAMGFTYTMASVGFSVTTAFGNLEALEALEGVKSVYVAPEFEVPVSSKQGLDALTANSSTMIGANVANSLGYTGRGMRIAILDTGIAVDHPSFAALPDEALVDPMTRDSVEKVWSELNAGKMAGRFNLSYYNSKLPFVFNYSSGTFDVSNSYAGSDHGTHVAGIAAANKVDGSEVVGVAPDAQLLIMKVFGKAGGAYTEDIIAALEDALILGVDVVNMSLGTTAGFTSDTEEVDAIYQRVATTGTVLAVSAGNSYTAGYNNMWGTDQNLTEHVDNGLVGAPGLYANVLTVASVENTMVHRNYIAAGDYKIAYNLSSNGSDRELTTLTESYGLVAVPGLGEAADYEGLDVTGKVVLVQRGTISFAEKHMYAEEAGAAAVLVYNNTASEQFGMEWNSGEF